MSYSLGNYSKGFDTLTCQGCCLLVLQFGCQEVTTLTLSYSCNIATALFALNSIAFPVPESLPSLNNLACGTACGTGLRDVP